MDPDHAASPADPGRVRRGGRLIRGLGFGIEWFPNYVNTTLRPHGLDVVRMPCVVRGTGRHVMGDETFDVVPGSVGITRYGQTPSRYRPRGKQAGLLAAGSAADGAADQAPGAHHGRA